MYQLNKEFTPYYHFKKASGKSKGTIVFIHGYAVQSDYHNSFSDKLTDYDYLAIEHAGHGITPLESKKDLKPIHYAKEVCKLIEKLDLHDIYLMGHSMGGGIAMMVSTMIPQRIKKMVIATPMNSKGTTKVFNFLFKFQPKNMKQIDTFYDILMYDYANNKHKVTKEEIESVIKNQNAYKKNFNKLKWNMASLPNMLALKKAEKNLSVPTLLIVGKHDGCINAKTTTKNLKKKMKGKENLLKIYQFENAGHIPFLEETDLYYQVIMEFFNE